MKPQSVIVSKDLIAPLPKGPLDAFRKQASFDWKQLKLVINGKETLEQTNKLIKFLKSDPLFSANSKPQNQSENRALATYRTYKLLENKLHNQNSASYYATALVDGGTASVKKGLLYETPRMVILRNGSTEHEKIVRALDNGEINFAFCLTEIAHGTNTRAMKTRATYDPNNNEFVVHTPQIYDAKCWAGNLGQTATHALLFAQLYTPDGQCHGLHTFVVPIRNPATLLPYPGVTVGDMGEKAGHNDMDNGFLIFDNYRIPKENLLNKHGDVTRDGQYKSNIKSASERFGTQLANLSTTRVFIIGQNADNLRKAITIAIRYGAMRKQFGPDDSDEEQPILSYQLHKWRLIPYLAATFVLNQFNLMLTNAYKTSGNDAEAEKIKLAELHVLSCCGKSVSGWVARDGIQECREACGGHGYLKISGIPDVKSVQDAALTYEGDNNVILQQTSNYLLGLAASGQEVKSALGTFNFVNKLKKILAKENEMKQFPEFLSPKVVLSMYEWLMCYLIETSSRKLREEKAKGKNSFSVRNNCQVFHLRNLAIACAEYAALKMFFDFVRSDKVPKDLEDILYKLGLLYGLWSLEKHMATFTKGGFFSQNPDAIDQFQRAILHLCNALATDSVSLVDVIAPPDELFDTCLGRADGEIYKHLMSAMMQSPGAMGRPQHWREIVNRPKPNSVALESKL